MPFFFCSYYSNFFFLFFLLQHRNGIFCGAFSLQAVWDIRLPMINRSFQRPAKKYSRAPVLRQISSAWHGSLLLSLFPILDCSFLFLSVPATLSILSPPLQERLQLLRPYHNTGTLPAVLRRSHSFLLLPAFDTAHTGRCFSHR